MPKISLPPYATIGIANGAVLSHQIDFDESGSIGFTVPALFDGTHLGVFGASTINGTYRLLHDKDNTPIGIQNVRAGRTYVLYLAYAYPFIKLGFFTGTVSASVDATLTTQTADRTFTDVVRA